MTVLRSSLFWLALLVVTPPYALLALASAPFPRQVRYRVISGWSRLVVWLLDRVCRIRWSVEGREHLPASPAVILSKHQSAWETLAFRASCRRRCMSLSANCCGSRSSAGDSR